MKFMIPILAGLFATAAIVTPALSDQPVKSIYDFKVKNIDGKETSLSDYKGKTVMIVNVASKCGFTKQYADLQAIYKKYKDKDFVILGFPANNYGHQEPGTNAEIKEFCSTQFSVTFPMFSKVSVKGEDQAPLFKYLTSLQNPDFKGDIAWNFEKFLIGKDGKLLHRFRSKVVPTSDEMKKAIETALKS